MTPAEQRTAAKNFAYDWLSRKGRKTKAASAQAASTKAKAAAAATSA